MMNKDFKGKKFRAQWCISLSLTIFHVSRKEGRRRRQQRILRGFGQIKPSLPRRQRVRFPEPIFLSWQSCWMFSLTESRWMTNASNFRAEDGFCLKTWNRFSPIVSTNLQTRTRIRKPLTKFHLAFMSIWQIRRLRDEKRARWRRPDKQLLLTSIIILFARKWQKRDIIMQISMLTTSMGPTMNACSIYLHLVNTTTFISFGPGSSAQCTHCSSGILTEWCTFE